MNKDKEIEEIAQAQGKFCKDNGRSCGDCPVRSGKGGLAGKCQYYAIAERLYDNGIRVAREVRKETAKEILAPIYGEAKEYGISSK